MELSQTDRKELIDYTKACVKAVLQSAAMPQLPSGAGIFSEQRGCFVTLTNSGQLRGCIGTFSPRAPLAKLIPDMARSACNDPRFVGNPVTAGEFGSLSIKLSVLSPLAKIANPLDIELGVHGIYIIRDGRSGCFLPEVATEQNWSKQEFLSYCCAHKAGLPANAWQDEATEVLVFTSDIIS